MSRITGAAKKAQWKDLAPLDQFDAFVLGDKFVKDIFAHKLAIDGSILLAWLKKENRKIRVFRKSRKNSVEHVLQAYVSDAMSLMFDCISKRNGGGLRNLADTISNLGKPWVGTVPKPLNKTGSITVINKPMADRTISTSWRGPADPYRAWIWFHFRLLEKGTKRPINVTEKFFEFRAGFDKQFPDNDLEDSQLRTMLHEMGVLLAPDKKGPKGPRVR